ncbi:MAG TPA: (2Fe-2S) ferredoxin domain-containing protein [Acidiferrobacteraceae bacterium]|nr:(2Fe-2S) ferredoxin domain-containing protein [Acidiferrobacteraceae bacterium]
MTDFYYKYHLFFCVNQRQEGEACCANAGGVAMRDYAKGRIKALGMAGKGEVRINQAGCLNRCGEGPVVVVYPEGVWYSYVGEDDIDEIIDEHLCHGRVVKRLLI